MSDTIRAEVKVAVAAGLCVLPPRHDGTKRPIAEWAQYQARMPTADELREWYSQERDGLGIVCGAVSGGVEMFEFDDPTAYEAFAGAAIGLGRGELLRRIADGWSDESPKGGTHWYYRCAEVAGNLKLARRPAGTDDHGHPKYDVLIETRGNGGYAVIAPSGGRVHASGRPYVRLAGGPTTIATITPDERAFLHQLARSYDQTPAREPERHAPREAPQQGEGLRPGDDFAARTTWHETLEPHGWKALFTSNGKTFWRRPGKDEGWSATTNYANSDLLYVFSSSTLFEPERGYGKFGAYALLNHDSDFRAAAHALKLHGYGSQEAREPSPLATPKAGRPTGRDDSDRAAAPAELPIIDAGDQDMPRIAAQSWEALCAANEPPMLFRYAGLLGRFECDEQGVPLIRTLNEQRMTYELARAARWRKTTKSGVVSAYPPVPIVRDLLAAPEPPLPPLDAITEVPVFAPDGGLQLTAGYHPEGRIYYAPAKGFTVRPVTDKPTWADVERARGLIVDELLGDFPFVDAPEQAHAVGLLILPFVRALIKGPTPLHLIEKPMPGTGASLLADMLTYPAAGRPATAMTEGRDEDEWRKRITARLRGGTSSILIDNLRERLETASLAAALTADHWEDRLLGTSETIRIPVRCTWIATGNNPAVSSEIARRTVRIRLDAQSDRPWLRRVFRHPNLRQWAIEQRPELVRAALTLGQAWLAAGQPVAPDAPSLGMYEGWSRVIGGILDHAGILGFLGNLSEFYDETDTEGATVRAFIAEWWERHANRPVGVADLFKIVVGHGFDFDLGDKGERSQRIKLGKMIGELKDRHYQIGDGGVVRVSKGGTAQRLQLWALMPIGQSKAA